MQRRWLSMLALVPLFALLLLMGNSTPAFAQATIQSPFDNDYTISTLGSVPGLPIRYGGLTFKFDDPNTILIGGDANRASGKLYSIGVVRDGNSHIIGFSGTATVFADAAYNDGGVDYGPGNVLFLARWPNQGMGQTKPGSTFTDKVTDLAALGVGSSGPGGLTFVPHGFPGAGQLKIVTWPAGQFYTLGIAPDGTGTFDVTSATLETVIVNGPEGFIYIPPGSPVFPGLNLEMLVCEWSAGNVAAYEIDSNGNPIPATRTEIITDLLGCEGSVIDPLTGDFLFSTFGGGHQVFVVEGFVPPPPPPPPVEFLLIDEDTIDNGIQSIEIISFGSPFCGDGDPSVCVNDDISDPGVRDLLFTQGIDITPRSGLMLPTGEVGNEGLFRFTNPDPQQSQQGTAPFTIQEFIFADGAAADENNLDKINGVVPLSSADILALVGKTVCAVVYDSDVSVDTSANYASLGGATSGLTAFIVTAVGPDPDGPAGSVLPPITVDLLASAEVVSTCEFVVPPQDNGGGQVPQ